MSDLTVSPAMKKFCAQLRNPNLLSIHKDSSGNLASKGIVSFITPSRLFVDRLLNAGLVAWVADGADERVILTEAGQAAAAAAA